MVCFPVFALLAYAFVAGLVRVALFVVFGVRVWMFGFFGDGRLVGC